VRQNLVELEDDLMGIIDNTQQIPYIDMVKADISYTKSNQVGGGKGMVYYANFILSE
jgi:hypothetical protein